MFTNNNNLPLSLAVFLAYDEYPSHEDRTISVTTLLKPIKQIVLGMRANDSEDRTEDISTRIASAMGTAVHNGIEKAWTSEDLPHLLLKLGYPPGLVKQIKVNPSDDELDTCVPVYTEYRTAKKFRGWTISGEFDFVAEGRVRDFKTTGVFTYIHGTNDENYPLQGSMYRWLNPERITDDVMAIDYIFTDWSALAARTQKGYPPARMLEKTFLLRSFEDTEKFISNKLAAVDKYIDAPQNEIPACTNEDLWVEPSKWKYYAKVGAKRATKVYDNAASANAHFVRDGSVGMVREHKGAVKACKYCSAFATCEQANRYLNSGELKL